MIFRDTDGHPIAVTDRDGDVELLVAFSDESRSIILTSGIADALGRELRVLAADLRRAAREGHKREWAAKGYAR